MRKLGRGLDSLIPLSDPEALQSAEEVSVSQIQVNPQQPRKQFDQDSLDELSASIKEHGVIQPLVVTRSSQGYELVAGQRRLEAAKLAGLSSVPVIVRTASEQQKLEVAIIENVQRQALNPMEEAVAYKKLVDEFNLTQEDVATKVGKARASVANTIRLLQLPQEVQEGVLERKITEGHARALLSLDESEILAAYERVVKEGLSVRQTEQLSKQTAGEGSQTKKQDPTTPAEAKRFIAIEEALRERFGTKATVSLQNKKGTISLQFFSREELERILEQLGVSLEE